MFQNMAEGTMQKESENYNKNIRLLLILKELFKLNLAYNYWEEVGYLRLKQMFVEG